jgi:integrase
VDADRWQIAVKDGRRFVSQWGEQAEALGWTAQDIFGRRTQGAVWRWAVTDLTPKYIKIIRNDFRDRHGASAAKIVLGVISTVWKFIFEEDPDLDLAANPTAGISGLYKTENEREPWPDEVLEAFEKSAPLKLRLAFYIALYNGKRRSDVAKMEWPQRVERDGKLWLKVRPQKTQKKGTEYLEGPVPPNPARRTRRDSGRTAHPLHHQDEIRSAL